jgi:hypothetical protein
MGKVYDALDDELCRFIAAQHLFFVATAPSGDGGHVNLSPKGYDTFRILDPGAVAYLDLTGSGVETIAHLRDNGRITLMFCAFEGPPRILRIHGRGEAIGPGDERFAELAGLFPPLEGVRSVIRIGIERVSTSCGYAVPLMAYERERDTLVKWCERKGPEGIAKYKREKNGHSIDGLPGLSGLEESEGGGATGSA